MDRKYVHVFILELGVVMNRNRLYSDNTQNETFRILKIRKLHKSLNSLANLKCKSKLL
jgi:hypothetical protein